MSRSKSVPNVLTKSVRRYQRSRLWWLRMSKVTLGYKVTGEQHALIAGYCYLHPTVGPLHARFMLGLVKFCRCNVCRARRGAK